MRLVLWTVALLLPACAAPSLNPPQVYRVPFELDGGHIYLNVSLDNTLPRWFILDSGSAYTLVNQSQAQALDLAPQKSIQIKGVGEQRIPATLATGTTFNMAGVTWNSEQVLVAPPKFYTPLQQYFGREFSGIIGSDLFETFVVEVDYGAQMLHLHDPGTYRYQGTGYKLPLLLRKQKPYVKGTIQLGAQKRFKSLLLLDLGSGSALDINEPVTPKVHQWLSRQPSLPRVTVGAGGEKPVQVTRMEALELGKLTIPNPITEFSLEQPSRQQRMSGRVGGQIFRHFRVILNYARKRLILEPQPQATFETDYDMSGLWLKSGGTALDQVWVARVFPKSPAAEAGMKKGDRILSIDNQPASALNQVRQLLKGPNNAVRRLQVQRAEETLSIQLTLKDMTGSLVP